METLKLHHLYILSTADLLIKNILTDCQTQSQLTIDLKHNVIIQFWYNYQ